MVQKETAFGKFSFLSMLSGEVLRNGREGSSRNRGGDV